ncbi:MAG: zinc ribbon domain-containing protein [Verrucomicrobiales bacterium]|nr:zinc ribbon domain-containing protein [Verrucomicrobiales bacterium]
MPTYDYKCEKCGHQFEVFQSMKDDRLTDCPQADCGGHVRRLLGTGAGIIFKGSGFYQTDYRSDSYKKAAKADSGSGSSGGGGGGGGGGDSSGGGGSSSASTSGGGSTSSGSGGGSSSPAGGAAA